MPGARRGEMIVAPVFAKFHDIYQQAGLHGSYGFIDDREGKTFQETLDLAFRSNARLVQIATWNDYGEGTMIEPTTAFGYQYLESIQRRIMKHAKTPLALEANDLRLPVTLYELRKRNEGDSQVIRKLNQASELLFAGKKRSAESILNDVRDLKPQP